MKRIVYALEDIWAFIEVSLVSKKELHKRLDFNARDSIVMKKIDSLHSKNSEAPLDIDQEKIIVLASSIAIGETINEYLSNKVITGRIRRITCIDTEKKIYRIKTRMSIYLIYKVIRQ